MYTTRILFSKNSSLRRFFSWSAVAAVTLSSAALLAQPMREGAQGGEAPEAAPHAHAQGSAHGGSRGDPDMFEPPPDTALEDATLPAGSIEAEIVDKDETPLSDIEVTLAIVENSVAKGENHRHETKRADARGHIRFDSLQTGSGVAYRVTVAKEGATYALPPFPLGPARGIHGKLHVYKVTHSLADARIGMQSMLYCELKDDRLQIEQTFTIFNVGDTTWVPNDVIVGLPLGFMAFTTQQGMTDVGLDVVPDQGVKLRGTIAPGRHEISARWQLPYHDEKNLEFAVGMPPRMVRARVITAAATGMKLTVEGFPTPQPVENEGQRFLVTDKQLSPNDPLLERLTIGLVNIPQAGLPPWLRNTLVIGTLGLALAMALFALISALTEGRIRVNKSATRGQRVRLLAELEDLERSRNAGDIGPKTYERARRELVDAIARSLGSEGPGRDTNEGPYRAASAQ